MSAAKIHALPSKQYRQSRRPWMGSAYASPARIARNSKTIFFKGASSHAL
jgi:hypothetical protein